MDRALETSWANEKFVKRPVFNSKPIESIYEFLSCLTLALRATMTAVSC